MFSKSISFDYEIDLPIDCNRTLMPLTLGSYFDYSSYDYACFHTIPNEFSKQNNVGIPSSVMVEKKSDIRLLEPSHFCMCNGTDSDINVKQLENHSVDLNFPKRKPAILKFDFYDKVQQLISLLSMASMNEDEIIIHRKNKMKQRMRTFRGSRSRYIGVTLNKNSWQALISVGKKKTYIGSYPEEVLAAISFDFYSIVLQGLNASTNFDYTRRMVIDMIDNYLQNGNKFVAKLYH